MSEDNMTPENKQNNAIMIHPTKGGVATKVESVYTRIGGDISPEKVKTLHVEGVGEVIDATASGLVNRPDYRDNWSAGEILKGVKSEGKAVESIKEPTFRENIGGSWRKNQGKKGQAYYEGVLLGEAPNNEVPGEKAGQKKEGTTGEKQPETRAETKQERYLRLAGEAVKLVATGVALGEVLETLGLDPDDSKAVAGLVRKLKAAQEKAEQEETEGDLRTEPTKPQEPKKEPEKKSEFSNFGDAYAFLKNNWRMEPHLNGEEKIKYDEALRVKRMGIEAASKHGTNSFGENKGLFDQAKGQVADLMRQLITDDNYWTTVQSSGMARGDIISKLADGLDPIRRATSDGQGVAQGIRDPWFEGIVRNWQLAFLKAKDGVGIPGNRADQIKNLQEEMRILNWGAVSTPETLLLIDSLANKAVSWEIQNDPNLKAWADAQTRRETNINSGNTTVEIIETDHPVEGIFDAGFLKRHGLPEKFSVNAGSSTGNVVKKYEVDVLGALEKMYETGAPSEFFQTQEFINACNNPLEARKFGWGIVPLIRLIRTNPGTYSGLIDSKTGGGLIPELKLSIRGIATAFENDEEAKRCLGIFLQMDSQTYPGTKDKVIKVPEMQREDQLFAQNLQAEYDTALRTNHLKWTNNESRDWWRDKAIQIAEHVGCDRGTAELMGEFAVLINGGPKMVDNRALLFKHANPNKPDGPDRFLIGNQFEEAALPFLAKIFVKKDDKEAKRLGKMGPRYDGDRGWDSVFLNDYLRAEGIDGLMQAVIHMQIDTFGEMRYIQALKGMGTIKSSMDEIKKLLDWGGIGRMAEKPADVMIKLKDAFSALVTPEVPLINQFTVQKIGRAISELDSKVGDVSKSIEPTAGSQAKEFGFQVVNVFGLGIPGLIRGLFERRK